VVDEGIGAHGQCDDAMVRRFLRHTAQEVAFSQAAGTVEQEVQFALAFCHAGRVFFSLCLEGLHQQPLGGAGVAKRRLREY